jgi:hypothetical protein
MRGLQNLYFSPSVGEKIKENEMDGACDSHGRDEKHIPDFNWKI